MNADEAGPSRVSPCALRHRRRAQHYAVRLPVPKLKSSAYSIFHNVRVLTQPYQGVGRGTRRPRRGSERRTATYWVCSICDVELRARRGQHSMAVWDCPTARDGGDGCKCCMDAKQQHVSRGKRPKSTGFSLPMQQ
jgi:hypothetical protein